MNKTSVASIVVPLVGAVTGFVVLWLLGSTLTVSVAGQDLPVEVLTATLGLIIGYFVGTYLAPKPEPAPAYPEPVSADLESAPVPAPEAPKEQ